MLSKVKPYLVTAAVVAVVLLGIARLPESIKSKFRV